MLGYSEKAQPFLDAIAEGLFQSTVTRNWLINGTPYAEVYYDSDILYEEQRAYRPNTKQPFWANYFCGRDRLCECRIDGSRSLESDAIFFFRNAAERVLAVHVEFKHNTEAFGFGQPEAYPLRAACFQKTAHLRKTLNPHDDWATVLFCGEATLADARIAHFNRVITHAEAVNFIPNYPSVLK